MKTILSFFFILVATTFCFAQTSGVNQFDANGKKDGKWIVYWDAAWKEVKDSSKAVYSRYTYYDHGMDVYPMGPRNKKWKLVCSDSTNRNEKIKMLDGEYKWYDEKGILRDDDVFKNGDYVSYKWYYSSGELNQVFDYTKHAEGQPHSWYVTEYDKKGNITRQEFVPFTGH